MTPTEFMQTYERACRAHDLAGAMRMIDEQAVYWFSDGSCHRGGKEIAQALADNFAAIESEDYRISNLVWLTESNETAVGVYRFEWTGVVRGAPAGGTGRGTTALIRRDGEWVVAHEHLSQGSIE